MHTKCSDPKSLDWSTEYLKTQRFVREIQIKLKQRNFLLLISSALWLLLPKTKSSSSVLQSGQETILFLLIQGLTNGQTLLPNTLAFLSREAEEYGPLCNCTIPPAPLVKNRHHHLRPPCRQTTASRTSGWIIHPRGPAMRRGLTTSVRFSPVMCKPSPFPGNPQSIPLYTVSCSPPKSPYGLPDLLLGWHWPHTVRFLLQLFGQRLTASGVPQANQTQ